MQSRILTVSYIPGYTKIITPYIRLKGQWLLNGGFNHGDKILVEMTYERLTITKQVKGKMTNGMGEYPKPNDQNL